MHTEIDIDGAPAHRAALPWLLRFGSLALLAGSVAAYVRGNDLEADALEQAGGDAGLYGVGVFFVVVALVPAAALLAASAVRVRRRSGAWLALASGVLDLALAAWLAFMAVPLERRTDDGLLLAAPLVEQANVAYLLWLALLAAAGAAALLAGWSSLRTARA